MDQLYLCRHAETAWTLSGKHTSKTDLPLTQRGELQAESLRKGLQKISFEKVFSSPAKRAMDTCRGLHATMDLDLAEWNYGDFEGLTSQEIHEKNPAWNLFMD